MTHNPEEDEPVGEYEEQDLAMNKQTDKLDGAAERVVKYLYHIDGDCSPELYRLIDTLRQLINEEFVGKDKSVSSQFLFDIIQPALLKHYISRDEVMEKLPKKRPDAIKQGEIIPFDGKKKVEMHWLRKCQDAGYNQAISDMRQALTTNEEE